MKHYNFAFCGIGSIASRHIGNLATVLNQRGESFSIDLYRSGQGRPVPSDFSDYIRDVFPFSEKVPKEKIYDAVFVTNPTSVHYETLRKFIDNTKAFFIEKPVFDSTEVDTGIFDDLAGVECYVACPLRYHPVLAYVKENVALDEVICARAISSSYLPEWRPGQDYRKCYSAHRNMGGGVAIDLIHEWDYLSSLFGMPITCLSLQGKISELEIDSDDYAVYIAKTDKTILELHLDYFGRKAMRTLDLFLDDETIHCDILNGRVEYLKEGRTVILNCKRNVFQLSEMEQFIRIINHETTNNSTAEHAFKVLKLAKGEY